MTKRTVLPWVVEGDEPLLDLGIFRINRRIARSQMRSEHRSAFTVLRCPDWVNVIAVTDDEYVVMVEQYRHGTGELTLEIPGGMVEPGETFVEGGIRELAEETGYCGDAAELIGAVHPNPAIQTNRCGTILVRRARLTQEQQLDPNEEISVSTVRLGEIPSLIDAGRITHSLVVSAFFHFDRWRSGSSA